VKRFYIEGSAKVHSTESISGADVFFADLRQSPSWLTNLLLCLGCWALITRRWLTAGLAGLLVAGWALISPYGGDISLTGYQMYLASAVLMAGGGLYELRRSRREARARDVKATLFE
jgi:hypothetical protein